MNLEPGTGDILTSMEDESQSFLRSTDEVLADLLRRMLARPDGVVIRTLAFQGRPGHQRSLVIDTPITVSLSEEESATLYQERRRMLEHAWAPGSAP